VDVPALARRTLAAVGDPADALTAGRKQGRALPGPARGEPPLDRLS